MSKILVTGGAGFIGSHLVDHFIKDGHQVVNIDNLSTGKKENINKKCDFFKLDIRDFTKIAPKFKGVNVVFHAAADPRVQMSIEKPLETHATNVTGTLNVLWAAKKAGVKKVIFLSSCTVYGDLTKIPFKEYNVGNPVSPYGLHKAIGEQYVKLFASQFGLAALTLRLFNVYGPRKTADGAYPMVIPIFLKQKKQGRALTVVGDGRQTRDYVHVYDVVDACVRAWRASVKDGRAINIASGVEISVNDIAKIVSGRTGKKIHLPPRPGEMRFVRASITEAKRVLGWLPKIKFIDGLIGLM